MRGVRGPPICFDWGYRWTARSPRSVPISLSKGPTTYDFFTWVRASNALLFPFCVSRSGSGSLCCVFRAVSFQLRRQFGWLID